MNFTKRTEHWLNVIFRDKVLLPGTEGVIVPSGTTGQRPVPPDDGTIRYNTTELQLEVYRDGNWETILTSGNVGENNTASNVGAGFGVFKQKTGVDLEFKSLTQGANITITDNGNELEISTSGSVGESNTASNIGAGVGIFNNKVGIDLEFRSLVSLSPQLTIAPGGNVVNFSLTGAPYLSLTGGTLSGNLILSTGRILNSNGSETVPSYSFGLDQDTGMYSGGANTLVFTGGGNNRLFIENDGTLSVPPSANYENLVTADDDIPNKKYVDDAIAGSIGVTAYRQSFTSANVIGGIVQFAHNIGQNIVNVMLYDNFNRVIIPDSIDVVDANTTDVNIFSYGTIIGTWNVIIVG